VSVPADENHKFGRVELPHAYSFFAYRIFEEKLDPTKHFVIQKVETIDQESWENLVTSSEKDEALIFVHGFNTSFADAVTDKPK
jgi:esterase/lipase superfamily enzyme